MMASTNRKRRIQYSLLSFMAFVTATGVGLGVWHGLIEPIRKQWQAVGPLIEAGASVESRPARWPRWMIAFLAKDKSGDIVAVNFNRIDVTDELVQALTKLPHLERLYMERTNANDQHAAVIAKIQSLRRLSMWGTSITDSGGRELAKLENLDIADLNDTGANWRTHLEFQEKSKAKVKTRYAGWVELQDAINIPELARLRNPPVTALAVSDLTDEELSQCIDAFEGLRDLTLKNKYAAITQQGLRAIWSNQDIERLSIAAYDLPNRFEVLQSVSRFWGPSTSSLDIESHDRVYLDFGFTTDSKSQRSVEFHCHYRNIQEDGMTGEDFASLEGLEGVTSLRFHSYVGPEIAQIALALPNLKHVSFLNQSANFPKFYSDILPRLKGLESFHFVARLPWAPVQPPIDFFSDWESAETLRDVRIFNGGFTRAHLQPLLEFSHLRTVLVQDRGFGGEKPRDILSELKQDAVVGQSGRD